MNEPGIILVVLVCILIGVLSYGTYVGEDEVAPVEEVAKLMTLFELCDEAAKQARAVYSCQQDMNCFLTLGDYIDQVVVDDFRLEYCVNERQASKITKKTN